MKNFSNIPSVLNILSYQTTTPNYFIMKKFTYKTGVHTYILLLLSFFTLVSCNDHESDEPTIDNNRSVLVYILGNNSLSGNANNDLSEMEYAAKNNLFKGTLLCFFDDYQPGATLYKIDKNGKSVIKQYPSGYKTATPSSIQEAVNTMKSLYPAPSYGLVLWSHGSGWMPSQSVYTRSPLRMLNYPLVKSGTSKAFGQDGSDWLELSDIKSSLNDHDFEFIIFDACYMGQVEVAYQLKDKANYIIASPTEILAEGFPYDKVAPLFFERTPAIKDIASVYFEHYNAQTGANKSATVAAIDTRYMNLLGEYVKDVYASNREELAALPLSQMQRFDRYSRHTMFDLGQIIREIAPEKYAGFNNIMSQAIVYKNFTPVMFQSFMEFTITEENYSGLSSYIPSTSYADLNTKYLETDWGKMVLEN